MNAPWVKPGAKVAIWVSSGWGNRGTVTAYDEIDRVLKRDIVLKGGRRFYTRYSDPIEVGTSRDYRTTCILPADHIKVRDYETGQQESRRRTIVDEACNRWKFKPTVENADQAIAALEQWKALQITEAAS